MRGVVGWLPLADPDATAHALERLRGRGKLVGVRHLISNEPDPRWLLQDERRRIPQASGRRRARVRRDPGQSRAVRVRAQRRQASAGAQDRHEPSRPAADPGAGLGAVGDADRPRRRVPQHVGQALDRSRHHHALALVDRGGPALFRSCARPVQPRSRHGGEQLAGDPAGCELRGNAGTASPNWWPDSPPTSATRCMARTRPSGSTGFDLRERSAT